MKNVQWLEARKRPAVIRYFRWYIEMEDCGPVRWWCEGSRGSTPGYFVDTLEGTHRVSNGDYIVQGVEGEHYPVKPSIFEKTYTTEHAQEGTTMDFDLTHIFTYHAPDDAKQAKYAELRSVAHLLAKSIMTRCPDCPDRFIAINKVREAVMWANSSIALDGGTETDG